MSTDIIEVVEDGADIRVVSVSYDEVKPIFSEVIYVIPTSMQTQLDAITDRLDILESP